MATTTAGQVLDRPANGSFSSRRSPTPLTLQRDCQLSLQRKLLSNPQEMGMNSTNTFKLTMVIGLENAAVRCSSPQVSSSDLTSLGYRSPTKNVSK